MLLCSTLNSMFLNPYNYFDGDAEPEEGEKIDNYATSALEVVLLQIVQVTIVMVA